MPGGASVWDRMSEDDRNETVAKRLKCGELEIIYSRPGPNGLYYVTLRPSKEKTPEYNGACAYPDEN